MHVVAGFRFDKQGLPHGQLALVKCLARLGAVAERVRLGIRQEIADRLLAVVETASTAKSARSRK